MGIIGSSGEGKGMNGVVHFEVPTDNLLRAKNFYAQVFGWKTTDIPELGTVMLETTESEYGRPKRAGAINGSMTQRLDPAKQPCIVIAVQSIDATIQLVEQAGGSVVQAKLAVGS